jgi:hypothetical protein
MTHLEIIRERRYGDELFCREIIEKGTVSTVITAFIGGLTREVTSEWMILIKCVMFLFLWRTMYYSIREWAARAAIVLRYIFLYGLGIHSKQ